MKVPEVIIEWQDDQSSAKGWLVINSLKGGAAGGGTRMRPGCTKEEVIELAKTMQIKFTVSGPEIGGGKSGIDYDFKDNEDKRAILRRWFKYVEKELKTRYGTGGDQNVDLIKDVMPLLAELGIKHPQEGIVRGHYSHLSRAEQDGIINNLDKGVRIPVTGDKFLNSLNFTVSDIATGYGVASAVRNYYDLLGESLNGKRIIVEGFGNVGAPAAYFLEKLGCKIVGVVGRKGDIFTDQGLDVQKIIKEHKEGKLIFSNKIDNYLPADVFIPAATSHTIDASRLELLKNIGVKVIAPGANNPFVSEEVEESADSSFSVIPDFVANCGTARLFGYLMQPEAKLEEELILKDLDSCIGGAISEIFSRNSSGCNLMATMQEIVLDKI